MANLKPLTQVKTGESGIVVELQGGAGMVRNLENMGVRTGKKITKVSTHLWRGPQVIKVHHSQIALSFGMARRVIVEVEK